MSGQRLQIAYSRGKKGPTLLAPNPSREQGRVRIRNEAILRRLVVDSDGAVGGCPGIRAFEREYRWLS